MKFYLFRYIIIESFFFFRTKLEKAKKEQEDRLEYVKEQLEICSHDSKRQIKEITAKVEAQVNNFAADHLTYRSVTYKGYTDHGKKELIQKKQTIRRLELFKAFTSQESCDRQDDWNPLPFLPTSSFSFQLVTGIIASRLLCIFSDIVFVY